MIKRKHLIAKYIEFFKSKNHKEIPSESLIPKEDPTVLFTTAGMQPLVPYLTGQKHPLGNRLVNVQKCIRTTDIEEIGDTTHHTFFEMLGNWSLGDYWKKEAISFSYEFLTKELKIPKERLAITCFGGDKRISELPTDRESAKIWEEIGISKDRIALLEGGVLESKKNWWGPAGLTGPCGPDTEIFYWRPKSKPPKKFDPEDENWVEIWNNVFMEYEKTEDNKYLKAKQKNVDTGMGVERMLATLNNIEDNYLTDSFLAIINEIEKISGRKYQDYKKEMRIIADHLKASVLIISDGVLPGNTGRGYVLRRLIRRALVNLRKLELKETSSLITIAEKVFEIYNYPELKNKKEIINSIREESEKFEKTLDKGINEFEKFAQNKKISGKEAFLLFQSYGFPLEMTEELAKENKINVNKKEFEKELKKHQELSRTASTGTFKSGLSDNSSQTTKLHTATHLLNEALRHILGKEVHQRGSNITPERLRFDFNFPRKVTNDEIEKIENLVNKKISENLKVVREEMTLKSALKSGAQSEFGHKYPEKVSVYTILDKSDKRGFFSKEICTGPHVSNTKEIGKFKIIKEESSSAGIRRIKAIVED